MKRRIIYSGIIFILLSHIFFGKAKAQTENTGKVFHRLYTDKTRIITEKGKQVILKGCNLGNWLVMEMWMMPVNSAGVHDQYTFERKLAERFGYRKKDSLMEEFRSHWITERDFKIIASFGMNCIRVPFEYRILEDDDKPLHIKPNGWKWLDYTIDMAEKNGLYVILDMHGAPGCQSRMDHTGRADHNKLWSDSKYQNRTVWLWEQITKRYKDRPSVTAFDILNEPWGGNHSQLRDLVIRCYDVIRQAGCETIVIFPGFYDGIDFYGSPADNNWKNVMFTMHFYPGFFGWGKPDVWTHKDFLTGGLYDWYERMDRLQTPLLVGEFNVVLFKAGGARMMRRYYDAYAKPGWPATMWSYKVLTREGGLANGHWGMVVNKYPMEPLDINSWSEKKIMDYFKSLSTEDYKIYEELRYWMTNSKSPDDLDSLPPRPVQRKTPPVIDDLPAPWFSVDIAGALAGGQKINKPDSFTVWGGGADIWGQTDQFRFIYQNRDDDFELSVKIVSLEDVHDYAKAGLMVRTSLNPASSLVLLSCFPTGRIELAFRMKKNNGMQAKNPGSGMFPDVYLKLKRKGRTISSFIKTGTSSWQKVKEITLIDIQKNVYAGLAVLSHDNDQLVQAVFKDIKIISK